MKIERTPDAGRPVYRALPADTSGLEGCVEYAHRASSVVFWYDTSLRLWTIHRECNHQFQLGPADYGIDRSEAEAGAARMLATLSDHDDDR